MKKLTLFLLFFFSVSYAQIVKDVTVYRGDSTYIEFKATGNISAKGITFVVKLTRSFSSPRLIQKRNEIAGGSSSEITASFSAPYTKVRVLLTPNDTQDLTGTIYYYDIIAADVSNLANYFTFSYGKFNLVHDVQTPFDGTDLPENATRITTVSLANGSLQNEYAKWDTTLKAWVPSGMVPGSGSGSEFDSTYIYQRLDEKAELTATQTFTGLNTFSGNKTVFGTTTNDSVRVTGDMQVRRLGIGNKYGYLNSGLMLTSTKITQQNNTGAGYANQMFSFDADYNILGALTYGLTSSSGFGIFSYDLIPYSGAFNSMNALYLGVNSLVSLCLLPYKTYMEIDSLKFGSYINNVFTPVNKITMVADTFNFWGTTYINGTKYAPNGSVADADSLGGLPASDYTLNANLNNWTTNLSSGNGTQLRLGKSYNDKRFNNGAYSDVWNIDYVIPPYNLSASWLFPIEHRVDYYNDTLQTVSGVANLLKIDGTGTPIWRASTVTIAGQETQVNVGDLPDSVSLNYSASSTIGNNVVLSEENLSALETRYPMQIKGYNFRLGTNNYYIYPKIYSYYSDLSTGNIEDGYHFYGNGDYPSYFGGNIITDGYLRVQDSIIIGTSTVKIYPDSVLVGGVRLAKITEAGSLDTSIVNSLIEANEDSSGQSIIGTTATLDSIITDYWNDALGGSSIDTTIVNALIEANEDTSGSAIIGTTETLDSLITDYWNDNLGGGSAWDSTYAYQRIVALENDVSALQDTIAYFTNAITSILTALDTCGCGADLSDNTPPLKPTSYVAVGGTSETQYVTTWTDPVASDLDSIRWYEGSSADTSAMNWIASIVAGTETYTRTGRTANTTYWSAVKAIDDSGNVSYFSNVDSATTIPSPCTPLALDTLALATAEAGTVSPFSATYNTGGTFSATTGSKYAGTYGYQLLFNGTAGTNTVGGTIHEGTLLNDAGNTEVYAHGYFKISSNFQTANNAISELFRLDYSSSSMTGINIVSNASGIPYAWQTSYRLGNTNTVTTNFALDEWIEIEIYHKKGTGSNSVHKIWVNGTLILDASDGQSTYDITRLYFGTGFDSVVNTAYIWADEISVSTQRIGCDAE